jgi:GNAT superfamily N-acetyltransferase
METLVRPRAARDLGECLRVLEAVHHADGYPNYWPDDPARWLSPTETLGAWVAEADGLVLGHIVLRAATAEAGVQAWFDATGLPPERLASVTRFFVSPELRGAGIGGALLDAACAEAAARGLRPALEVVETDRDAGSLYERRGWRRVHSERWAAARDGETMLHHYVAPQTTSSRAASPAA